jgi:membrane associated rhomboid family serine protease
VIPLTDVIPRRQRAHVTLTLVAVHIVVFVVQWAFFDMPGVLFDFGVLPARPRWTTFVTAPFVHRGGAHVGLNMVFLWLFGPTVEDRTGHGRFLAFYALSALATTLAHTATHASSLIPFVGTTGAVAGVIGAYLLLYHRSVFVMLVPIPGLPLVDLPAIVIAGMWVVAQMLAGWTTATVAGLAIGAAAIFLFRRPERMQVAWWN